MSEYRDILVNLLKRALLAAPLFAIGLFILFRAEGGLLMGYTLGLVGAAVIIAGAIVLAFPLARMLAEPCGNLFWPGRRYDRPQPLYGIPQSKRAKGLYEEAIAGFEKIAEDYPDEVQPYVEMIEVSIVDLKDAERALQIYQRGISLLKKDDDKDALATMYAAIRTRLTANPGT